MILLSEDALLHKTMLFSSSLENSCLICEVRHFSKILKE